MGRAGEGNSSSVVYLLLLVPFVALALLGFDCKSGSGSSSDGGPDDGGIDDGGIDDGGIDDGGIDDGGIDDGGIDDGGAGDAGGPSCGAFGPAIGAIAADLGVSDCSHGVEPDIATFDHSADDIGPQPVAGDHTTITAVVPTRVELDAAAVDRLFRAGDASYPCEVGPNGFTVCTGDPSPNVYFVVFVRTAGTIPVDDETNHYQYGFVIDKDQDESNNYRGTSPYGDDLYDNTDTWLDVLYQPPPGSGWDAVVSDTTDGTVTPTSIPARVIIRDDTIVHILPLFTTTDFTFRVTAFRHPGDFGVDSGDFDGSVWPAVGEPLMPFPSE